MNRGHRGIRKTSRCNNDCRKRQPHRGDGSQVDRIPRDERPCRLYRERLTQALEQLQPRFREVLVLRELEGLALVM